MAPVVRLVRRLFGDEFDAIMKEEEEESAFCAEANAAIRTRAADLDVSVSSPTTPAHAAEKR